MTKKQAIFAYWIFMLVFFAILLEFAGRYYLNNILEKSSENKFRFNSYRVYEHVPGFTEGNSEKNWIEINNQGFRRSSDIQKEKPKDTFRAFLLGGSAAHGISSASPYPIEHVYMDQTIDAHLEKMVQASFPEKKIEIINAAVTGYQVFQHSAYLLSELLDYGPDLVIFVDGANDHFKHNSGVDYYGDFVYQYWKPRLQNPSLGGLIDYFSNYMSQYSGLFRGYVAWNLQRDAAGRARVLYHENSSKSDEEFIEGYRDVSKKQYLRSIQANIDILKRNEVDVLLTLQPILTLRDKTLLSEDELEFFREDKAVNILYPLVLEDLGNMSSESSVEFVDLNQSFSSKEHAGKQLFIDYVHLNGLGGEVIARDLFPLVRSSVESYYTNLD